MNTLTKAAIVDKLYKTLDITHSDAQDLVEAVLETIKGTLEDGEVVKLPGFGNFDVRKKRARRGRNPKTGEEVEISARNVMTFHPSNILRERVNIGAEKNNQKSPRNIT
ncbi:MAG: integration host factor subunit alpha [Nitrospirae bacterium]|nr:integration host factor subunit alpha [Magnetococcales bacterium]HAT49069.1 integration host factor subunit alpha [Alphaproteobacteria bacterium]